MKNKNVFELWRDRGKVLPFKVRRAWWKEDKVVTVIRVTAVKQTWNGYYGKAWVNDEWYLADVDEESGMKELSCAGCYQWEEVIE
jgi:hypothetical protein